MSTAIDTGDLLAVGRDAGLDAVGVAAAEPFASTRDDLETRRAQGLHGGMAFTYRNPARSTEPDRIVPGARSLVVGARSYLLDDSDDAHQGAGPHGTVARYAWIDHYGALRSGLSAMAAVLEREGWTAVVVADDNALVDREAARRAGLGWYGKNANLLLPGRGSWFVLGSVVTDAPLVAATELVEDGCGSCARCIDGCPTDAIVAPGVVDARRCLAWLVQAGGTFPVDHRVALGDRIYGCDDCQEVCPPNRVVIRRGDSAVPDPTVPVDRLVELLDLLAADDATLLSRHGRWYIAKRDPVHLRRNALIALGNVGDSHDQRVVDALTRALGHRSDLVRAHAVWAVRRLGLDHLLDVVADDDSAQVRVELDGPVPVRIGAA